MKVLVTGGAGYIGSTTCFALADAGHEVVILDSLVNGRVEYTKNFAFYKGDIADKDVIASIFNDHPNIECCLHYSDCYPHYIHLCGSSQLQLQLQLHRCKRYIFPGYSGRL